MQRLEWLELGDGSFSEVGMIESKGERVKFMLIIYLVLFMPVLSPQCITISFFLIIEYSLLIQSSFDARMCMLCFPSALFM